MRFLRGAALLLLTVLVPAVLHAGKVPVTVYADDGYAPYSYEEEGGAKGIYPDIFRRIFERMEGFEVRIVPMPWKRILLFAETGRLLAFFPTYYHPETRPFVHPYSEPVLAEEVVVFCREGVSIGRRREKWPEDFYGLRIGNNSGYQIGGRKFEEAARKGLIDVEEVPSIRMNVLKLLAGRLDCYINDRLATQYALQRLRGPDLRMLDRGEQIEEVVSVGKSYGYLAFSRKAAEQWPHLGKFLADFNRELNKAKLSGEVREIIDSYMR